MFHEAASCRIFGELPSVAKKKFAAGWPFFLARQLCGIVINGEDFRLTSACAANGQRDEAVVISLMALNCAIRYFL
jgi:hypothetical protein